jgi:hypothetical protein
VESIKVAMVTNSVQLVKLSRGSQYITIIKTANLDSLSKVVNRQIGFVFSLIMVSKEKVHYT